MNPRKITIYKLILLFIGMLLICTGIYVASFDKADNLSSASIIPEDGAIVVDWTERRIDDVNSVLVEIKEDERIVDYKSLPLVKGRYKWTKGEHGHMYQVSVFISGDNTEEEVINKDVLFLNYDEMPNLPLMIVSTYSGEDPTYVDVVMDGGDSDQIGVSITDNYYIEGNISFTNSIGQKISSEMKIKVRGNTSSAGSDKKSYKLKLSERYDLCGNGDMPRREWCLLNSGDNLKTYIGDYIGKECQVDNQYDMVWVNLIINGDYKGCYALTPAVCKESSAGYVSKDGYLFESDNYYWNSNGLYFKTDHQISTHGYTIKYPDIEDVNDPQMVWLKEYMQSVEDCFYDDEDYRELIDEDSFASWILARDILGNRDGNGSNIIFYKKSTDSDDKLVMGTLWDFDSIFDVEDEWSHSRRFSFFPALFSIEGSFVDVYEYKWNSISGNLYDDIENNLNSLEENYANELDKSWELEEVRYGTDIPSFSSQKEEALTWFEKRIEWIDNQLN